MDSRVVLLQQNTFREFTSAFSRMAVLSWSNKFAQYTPVIVLLLDNVFCVPKYGGHHLASRWLRLELLWPRGPRPYPLTTLSFILWLIIINPSLIHSHQTQNMTFDLKRFNKALHSDALVAICSSLRDLGTQRTVACAYLNDHVRLLKRYYVKCLMPALFLPPKFVYQSIPDPKLSYTFLRRWHPVGVQTWLHLLKTFYRV